MNWGTMLYRHWVHITQALAITVTLGSPTHAAELSGAPAPVAQAMAAQHLPIRALSFAIVDPDSGRILASLNGDTRRSPASTIKLITKLASLALLGPAYVWQTRALLRGTIKDGVLDLSLIHI